MRGQAGNRLLLLLASCALTTQALAAVRAALDASQIAAGDTVQLTLEHDGSTSGQPDVTPLQHDFDILGTSSSTSVQILNGSASEKTEVDLTLAPKVTGHLTIPSLSWDGERSQPLSLVVTGPGGSGQPGVSGAPSGTKVFIESSTSPAHPYVQAAVHLTVHLFTSEVLYHADLELPDNGNVLVRQIGSDESTNVTRNGQTYQVITRRYLLFPLHSGDITLEGPVLDAEVAVRQRSPFANNPFGGFFGGRLFGGMLRTARPVRLHGDPIVLTVRPRPAAAVASYWLPAHDLSLSADWNPAKLTASAGDPVTLDLDLRATGLTAAQLPDLASLLTIPSGLKAYPDQPKLTDSAQDGRLVGSRDQTIALMADSPGHYTIPALTVTWWDTQTNQSRVATLPARTLTILPPPGSSAATASAPPALAGSAAPGTLSGSASSAITGNASANSTGKSARAAAGRSPAAATQTPEPSRSPSEWEWISMGLAVVWLSTLGAWLWSRRSRAKPPPNRGGNAPAPRQFTLDASKERAEFRAACEANDAHAARSHLLAWTAALWGTAPAGINAVAARIGDRAVAELLRDLDRACYAGGTWQGHPLAAALKELPARSKSARERDGLAPLYP
ncbi:MAG TPA: BatD family protein [Steroidobacteraceae bacterium]|nr:BatD family protein [Steroidobacteraceae bacterium]